MREAIDSGLYDRFAFGDGAKRLDLVRSIGGDRLGGMYGTGPATASDSAASAAWEAAYVAEHGALPVLACATAIKAKLGHHVTRGQLPAYRNQLRKIARDRGLLVVVAPRLTGRTDRSLRRKRDRRCTTWHDLLVAYERAPPIDATIAGTSGQLCPQAWFRSPGFGW